jgi:hypothetical protein
VNRYNRGIGGILTKQAMAYFQGQGWRPGDAAGITANLFDESGLDTGAVGDGGSAHGLAQWHADRAAAIEKHFGKRIADMSYAEQLEAVQWELSSGPYAAAGRALRDGDGSARGAGGLVSDLYERPKDRAGEAARRANDAAGILAGTPLPENDPNGTRERAAQNVRVHGTADITVRDAAGNMIGRAAPVLMQMPGQPVPAGGHGASGSW